MQQTPEPRGRARSRRDHPTRAIKLNPERVAFWARYWELKCETRWQKIIAGNATYYIPKVAP